MLDIVSHFKPSPILRGKGKSLPSEGSSVRGKFPSHKLVHFAPCQKRDECKQTQQLLLRTYARETTDVATLERVFSLKYRTRMEVEDCKKDFTWSQCYENFYSRKLQIFAMS